MAKLPRSKKRPRAKETKSKPQFQLPPVHPWSSEPMAPIKFSIWCGTPAPNNTPQRFTYREEAPAIYFVRKSSTTPNLNCNNIIQKYISMLIEKHDSDILSSKNWKCVICGCRAIEMLYTSMPFLMQPQCNCHFEPSVELFGVPVCQDSSGRNCRRKIRDLINQHGDDLIPQHELNPMRCHTCGAKPGQDGKVIRKCLGCKLVGYCSKPCQALDWSSHKVECKLIQEEEQQEGFEEAKQWRKYLFG